MTSVKRHLVLGSLLLGSLAVPALASADASATPAPTPVATPTPLAWYQKITVGGYLNAYYQLDLNRPSDNQSSSIEPLAYRAYDDTINQFSYGGGELTLKQGDSASNTGYFVDMIFGPEAAVYNGSNDGFVTANGGLLYTASPYSVVRPYNYGGEYLINSTGSSSSSDAFEIGQAYVTQAFGNLTFTLGKFATPVGYEVTYLPSNANFSRSLLYNNEPAWETGLMAAYSLPAGFTVTGILDDGSNLDNAATNGKEYGAQVAYAGIKNLNLTGTYLYQDDLSLLNNVTNQTTGIFHSDLTNFVATYTATDTLSFAGEYLNLTTPLPAAEGGYTQSSGYALYSTWTTPLANLSLSPRFEQWFNPNAGSGNGYPYVDRSNLGQPPMAATTPYQLNDYTVTLKYQMGPLAHMLEYRCDASNRYEFVTGNVPDTTTSINQLKFSQLQQTLTYAAVYSF